MATSPPPGPPGSPPPLIPSPNPEQHRTARRYFQSVLPALSRASSTSVVGTRAKVEHGLSYPPPADDDDDSNVGLAPGEKPPLITVADRLGAFRMRVGIENAPILTASRLFKRRAKNIGLYDRICVAEYKAHWMHNLFAFLINFCLGAQIVLAAALTALGAGKGPHSAVTAFGALNTVMAGFLTFLKGSGLPNRMKYYETEWTRLREYIEQRERDFCTVECKYDVETEVFIVERMYEQVCDEVEVNTPESFTSVTDMNNRRENRPTPLKMAEQYRQQLAARDGSSSTGQVRPLSYPPPVLPMTVPRTVPMRAQSTGGTMGTRDKDDDIAHAV
jgi:SMODS and SLOG-associating 2TM effector domain